MPGRHHWRLPGGRHAKLQCVCGWTVLDWDGHDQPLRLHRVRLRDLRACRVYRMHQLLRVRDRAVQPDCLHQFGGHCVWGLCQTSSFSARDQIYFYKRWDDGEPILLVVL